MARRVKLVRVLDGLYRTEDGPASTGGITVARQDKGPLPWSVRWEDFMGVHHCRLFRTLAAARDYLDGGA
jgi:hypothetical protein